MHIIFLTVHNYCIGIRKVDFMGKHNHNSYHSHEGELENQTKGTKIDIDINVTKIVKYACITSVFIVGIIFGLKAFSHMIKENNISL